MTSERKKSIIILVATLVSGILLGLLIPGLFHKLEKRGRSAGREHGQEPDSKREWFRVAIIRIVQPDSAQARQIEPIVQWAFSQIEGVENNANQQMSEILDSVRIQLNPILTNEQKTSLNKFDSNAKKTWEKGRGHRKGTNR